MRKAKEVTANTQTEAKPSTKSTSRERSKAKRNRAASASFGVALAAANKRLAAAIEERAKTARLLAALEAEIPALERTIFALSGQLQPSAVAWAHTTVAAGPSMPLSSLASQLREAPVKELLPGVPYREPNLAGMGSVPATAQTGEPQAELSEDEALPNMGGGWQ